MSNDTGTQSPRHRWGMGFVVRGAEGSTGQSRSSANWKELVEGAAERLERNSPTKCAPPELSH